MSRHFDCSVYLRCDVCGRASEKAAFAGPGRKSADEAIAFRTLNRGWTRQRAAQTNGRWSSSFKGALCDVCPYCSALIARQSENGGRR